MPLFARRPAMVVLETGEIVAVLSECAQRKRGKSLFVESGGKDVTIICRETPHRNERLGWLLVTSSQMSLDNPTVTPILILENNARTGANPKVAHYLRDAQGLELTYVPTTKEFEVTFWWNLFTPTQQIPDKVSCVPAHLLPNSDRVLGDWAPYQDPGGVVWYMMCRPVEGVLSAPIPTGPNNLPMVGVFGRSGHLGLTLGLAPGEVAPKPDTFWKSVVVRVVVARREVPDSVRQVLKLPRSSSGKPDAGVDPPFGPYRDGNPQATVRLRGELTIGNEIQLLEWEFTPDPTNPNVLTIPSDGTNLLTTYTASVRFQTPHKETKFNLDLYILIDDMYVPVDHLHDDGFTSLFFVAVDATLVCQTSEAGRMDIFYSSYKLTPITFTLPLDQYEPHASQEMTRDVKFNYSVGDPPKDPGGGWAGIYNRLDPNNLLSVGAASPGKGVDPFQLTDAHRSLPVDPGLVDFAAVQKKGQLITLSAVHNLLDTYTQHLYHQREIQGSRVSSRVLMVARGKVQSLVLQEESPGIEDDEVSPLGGLLIGFSEMAPGVVDEQYVGSRSVIVRESQSLFPFGATVPGFITVAPGEVGHQFKVTGGTGPYTWCLRRTRSSYNDLAREPLVPGTPQPPEYPFDDLGNLRDPAPPRYPEATRGGGMPPGMLLDKNGLFYGTPTKTGTFLFRLHVKDSTGLRGEQTARFVVMSSEGQLPPCSEVQGVYPAVFKSTITRVSVPPIPDVSFVETWRGKVEATGGRSGKYLFLFPNGKDAPYQMLPLSRNGFVLNLKMGTGEMALVGVGPNNFSEVQGVWLFEVQATELLVDRKKKPTCDRRAVAMSIGVTQVAGVPDVLETTDRHIPEGSYHAKAPARYYLVLNPPIPVRGFIHGKNTYLRGSVPLPLRPDLGGVNFNPGIVTSLYPGNMNPVSVIGIGVETSAPSFYQMDWVRSNPSTYFREIFDRFDPVPASPSLPSPPLPPGSPLPPPVEGATIDDMIPIGKRIRPLWPV